MLYSVFISVINTWNLPSDLVQKVVSYSIHVIPEYNQAGSEIICRQINVVMGVTAMKLAYGPGYIKNHI